MLTVLLVVLAVLAYLFIGAVQMYLLDRIFKMDYVGGQELSILVWPLVLVCVIVIVLLVGICTLAKRLVNRLIPEKKKPDWSDD